MLEEVKSENVTPMIGKDFDSMSRSVVDKESCYFVFKLEGSRRWVLVSYVPDGVGVKEKMTYASSKGTLKTTLGYSLFEEEVLFTNKNDISWESYKDSRKPVESRSNVEVMRDEIYSLEDKERVERTQHSTSDASSLAVTIPFTESAKEAINKFKLGTVNFVTLMISEDQKTITTVTSKTINANELSKEINTTEPRFYIFAFQIKKLFIYVCPEKSPINLRMVYSTTKSHVADQIDKLGVNLAKRRLEVADGSELTEQYLREESTSVIKSVNPKAPPRGVTSNHDGTVKASSVQYADAPHPIYSLINSNDNNNKNNGTATSPNNRAILHTGGEKKKKIVIPPQHAW